MKPLLWYVDVIVKLGGGGVWVRVLREDVDVISVGEYVCVCVFGCTGIGMSYMKRLKRVGESTEPCGTQLGMHLFADWVPLWTV